MYRTTEKNIGSSVEKKRIKHLMKQIVDVCETSKRNVQDLLRHPGAKASYNEGKQRLYEVGNAIE
jgi:hypothetical protein